jgi:hypothetical protein
MVDYSKLDIPTLEFILKEYQVTQKDKQSELKVIEAELELIGKFMDYTDRVLIRVRQHQAPKTK